MVQPDEISDEQILYIVGTTDLELFRAGMGIAQRAWRVPHLVMQRLGYAEFVVAGRGKPQLLERIEVAFASIYRKQDLAAGGHIGVFMYHDIFARISMPIIYGHVHINPFEYVELTPVQLRIIQTEPAEMQTFIDQFCDVADIQYGSSELNAPYSTMELACRFIELARLHLHGAAAILTGGYDPRGAVQNALLASELALKGGAAAQNLDERALRDRFGHDADDLAQFVGSAWPSFDGDRVRRVISRQPKYVQNRYSANQPSRLEVGHIAMGAQFVVAEVVRQISNRNLRGDLNAALERKYPA